MMTQSTQTDDCDPFSKAWDGWLENKVVEADTATQEVPKEEDCIGSEFESALLISDSVGEQ